jgi:PIN domain nuclease of toxin-antitoxin system
MRLLLYTHIFLWYITGDKRVRPSIRAAIEDSEVAYLSVVSVWEATIKYQLGKLQLPEPPHPWLTTQREQHGIQALVLTEGSVTRLGGLQASPTTSSTPPSRTSAEGSPRQSRRQRRVEHHQGSGQPAGRRCHIGDLLGYPSGAKHGAHGLAEFLRRGRCRWSESSRSPGHTKALSSAYLT